MEACSRVLNLDQTSFNNILGCATEFKSNDQGTVHLPASGPREVVCPEPCHAVRVPCTVDSLNRSCCKPKRIWPSHRGDPARHVFNLFLGKDDVEEELDATSNQMSLLSCSPPVRTNNPLVHDIQFVRQMSILDYPSGNTQGAKHSSAREEGGPIRATSAGEKPVVRIEGFACGGSKSHCISALA